jgi:hypothetical protein
LKLPRIAIAELMGLVGLVAVDYWAYSVMIRFVPSNDRLVGALVATLPMANALAIGLCLAFKGWAGRSPSRPFLAGFVVVGIACVVLAAIEASIFPDVVTERTRWVIESSAPLLLRAGQDDPATLFALYSTVMAYLAVPQFILAVAGGLIARHYGIKLEIERRCQTPPRPDAPAVSAVS